jgi:hypothetical protein
MLLRIRVANPITRRSAYAFPMPEYNDYEGEIVPRPQWVKDDHFCLSTGNPDFPFRVIEIDRIICGWQIPSTKPRIPTYRVKSKGKTYLVTGGKCNCTGYSYRRHCTHVEAVKRKEAA